MVESAVVADFVIGDGRGAADESAGVGLSEDILCRLTTHDGMPS